MSEAEQLSTIQTREDLVKFLIELSVSYKSEPNSWRNNNLYSFLEALAPEWKTLAEMLIAAKYYE